MDADPDEKAICYHCVEEEYLRNEIREASHEMVCSYCGETRPAYLLELMAKRVEEAFANHFQMTSAEGEFWERSGEGEPVVEAIMGAAKISEEPAQDIQRILEDKNYERHKAEVSEASEFEDGSEYAEKEADPHAWNEDWNTFENTLKTEARFFSRIAVGTLTSIFASVETMSSVTGQPLVTEVGPDHALKSIFRARYFETSEELKECLGRPDLKLSGPSSPLARAGRMNAHGISVFYGALEPRVALAELRPPVGSNAVIGRFDLLRNLRLLDLSAFRGDIRPKGSIFDPTYLGLLERTAFLTTLSHRMTRPIMPTDEASEYLPTQAVADFLASSKINLDGIIYPSAQASDDGLNVVLFHKAARVEELPIPQGAEIWVGLVTSYEDEDKSEYAVNVTTPADPAPPVKPAEERLPFIDIETLAAAMDTAVDHRQPTLRVVLESLEVHYVKYVDVRTDSSLVARTTQKKGKEVF